MVKLDLLEEGVLLKHVLKDWEEEVLMELPKVEEEEEVLLHPVKEAVQVQLCPLDIDDSEVSEVARKLALEVEEAEGGLHVVV